MIQFPRIPMSKRRTDPSVFSEPHMRPPPPLPSGDGVIGYAHPDTPKPSEIDLTQDVRLEPTYAGAPPQTVEHSVWNEPTVAREQAQRSPDQLTYARWLDEGRARWGFARSWGLALLIALAAGPWAVAGVFMNGGQSLSGAL